LNISILKNPKATNKTPAGTATNKKLFESKKTDEKTKNTIKEQKSP